MEILHDKQYFNNSTYSTKHTHTEIPIYTHHVHILYLPHIGHPVSVCHQLSSTGTRSACSAHAMVAGSDRSPARNKCRREETSCCFGPVPSGSCSLIARRAVGAVNSVFTLCCSITLQKADESGVPTGLPS